MKKTCCCLTSLIVTIVVVLGALLGVGVFAYNKFVKPVTQLTVGEAFGVFAGLYGGNEKKSVTNPFNSEADLASLNKSFKEATFMTEDSNFDISEIVNGTLAKPQVTAPVDEKSNPNPLFDLLASVHFDFSSLKSYSGEKRVLRMKDTEIGAVLNSLFIELVESKGASLSDIIGSSLNDYLKVRQVTVNNNAVELNQSSLNVVLSLDARGLVASILTKKNQASVNKYIKGLLPKTLFITLTIYPNSGAGLPTIVLNKNNEKVMVNTLKLINNAIGYAKKENGIDYVNNLFASFDVKIKNFFEKMQGYVAVAFADSAFDANPIVGVLSALKINNLVTDTEFLYMVKYLNCLDLRTIVNDVWNKGAFGEFADRFKTMLAIESTETIDSGNFLEYLKTLDKKVKPANIDLVKTNEEMRLKLDYDSLASIMQAEKDKKATVKSAFDVNADIDFSFMKIKMTNPDTSELSITVQVKIKEIIDKEVANQPQAIKNLCKSLFPEEMYITIFKSMKDSTAPVKWSINGLLESSSDNLIKTITELIRAVAGDEKANMFEAETLKRQMNNEINKIIDSMNSSSYKIQFGDNEVLLPTIYETIHAALKMDETVTPDDIRYVMLGINHKSVVDGAAINKPFEEHMVVNTPETGAKKEIVTIPDLDNPLNTKFFLDLSDQGIMNSIIENDTDFSSGAIKINLLQLILLNNSENQKLSQHAIYKDWLKDSGLSENVNAIVATVKMDLSDVLPKDNNVVPSEVYVTIIQELPAKEGDKKAPTIFINAMSKKDSDNTQLIIQAAAKQNNIDIDIKAICKAASDKMTDFSMALNIPVITVSGGDIGGGQYIFTVKELFKNNVTNKTDAGGIYGHYYVDITDTIKEIIAKP